MAEKFITLAEGEALTVLGVDGATVSTGWGVIELSVRRGRPVHRFVACGCLRAPASRPLASRLATIAAGLADVIARYSPGEAAVELAFLGALARRNPRTAIALGEARGAILCTLAQAGVLKIQDYAPREVKATVTGNGAAPKQEVSDWVRRSLVGGDHIACEGFDPTDALAIALTHAVKRFERSLSARRLRSRPRARRRR